LISPAASWRHRHIEFLRSTFVFQISVDNHLDCSGSIAGITLEVEHQGLLGTLSIDQLRREGANLEFNLAPTTRNNLEGMLLALGVEFLAFVHQGRG